MTDTSVPPAPPTPPPTDSSGFFGWVRSLGVVRQDAWIGGVAGGLARRFGIDPLIVRGIFVVAALIGFPALLIYAIAWALLPDERGGIHLQEMFRGRFTPPMVAVIVIVLVSLVPIVPWFATGIFWPFIDGGFIGYGLPRLFTALLVLGLIALLIVAIVGIVRGRRAAKNPPAPSVDTSPASTFPAQAPFLGNTARYAAPMSATSTQAAGATAPMSPWTDDAIPAPPAPETPDAGRSAAGDDVASATSTPDPALAAWRQQHGAWQAQNEQWRRAQADADRRARDQAHAEKLARITEQNRVMSEARAAQRASRPRTSFAYIAVIVGLGAVAAALVALATAHLGVAVAAAAAAFAAAGVGALGMIIAGLLRRRSGFLTFLTIFALLIAVPSGVTAAIMDTRSVTAAFTDSTGPTSVALTTSSYLYADTTDSATYVRPFGHVSIDAEESMLPDSAPARRGVLTVVRGSGTTDITISEDSALDLQAILGAGKLTVYVVTDAGSTLAPNQPTSTREDDGDHYSVTLAPTPTTPTTHVYPIRLLQATDDVRVYIHPADDTKDGN